MHISLVGFGKMGHVVYRTAIQLGHSIDSIIDPYSDDPLVTSKVLTAESLGSCDLVIEFSHHEGIMDRLEMYQVAKTPSVIATTGWYDKLEEIEEKYSDCEAPIIWSGNFALGVHLFFSIVKEAARLMNNFEEYDAVVQELFHSRKGDSPSGTSYMLGKILTDELSGKDSIITSRLDRKRGDNEIHISSARGGSNPGVHTVIFDSAADSVEITHRARNREGFAKGALRAGEWLLGRQGGIYTINDFMNDIN
ncbi:MAG: 4-hydroxy-tetrahydrodipicolinate reductase [Sphaerochaetaceae bacterium]